jgi:tetratricopeptide (TPR) repeat protein
VRNAQGFVYIRINDFARARQVFTALARDPGALRPELKFMLLNNIAYANLMLADPALLPEADACSAEAYQNAPWHPAITGTRGAVLAALGRFDEGIPLLQEALARSEDEHGKASEACHLALAEACRGRPEAARRYLDTARALDPGCYMLARVEQRLSPRRPNPPTPFPAREGGA